MKKTKIYLLFAFLALFITSTTNAQFSIQQKDIQNKSTKFSLEPKEEITKTLIIKNETDDDIDISIYASDAKVSDQGSFTSKQNYEEKRGAAKWMKMSQDLMSLSGRETKEIKYTISIPEKATPGTYGAAISVASLNKNLIVMTGSGAIQSTRVVVPILIDIPGEKFTKITWNDFKIVNEKGTTFLLNIKNEGNTGVKINGTIKISGFPLSEEIKIPINEMTLFQDDEVNAPIRWENKPYFGLLKVKAELNYSEISFDETILETKTLMKEIAFNIIPWNFIFGLIVVLLLLILSVIIYKKKNSQYLKSCENYTIKTNDTLEIIAKNRLVDWKKIAKINKLKAPYSLKEGETILVPRKKNV